MRTVRGPERAHLNTVLRCEVVWLGGLGPGKKGEKRDRCFSFFFLVLFYGIFLLTSFY